MKNVLSLGAGVQSSTLAFMIEKKEIQYQVECAIFADTKSESPKIYEWLEYIRNNVSFPVHIVDNGNLMTKSLEVHTSKTGTKYMKSAIPAFLDGEMGKGIMMRQCTYDHKIVPIYRQVKKLFGKEKIGMLLGISTDEAGRMKLSKKNNILNLYPLIEKNMNRQDCLKWMKKHNYPAPPRSSCVFCPFHSNREWQRLKTEEPEQFQLAVEYERKYQEQTRNILTGIPFLHVARKPLDQIEFFDERQVEMFTNECEGMCGI